MSTSDKNAEFKTITFEQQKRTVARNKENTWTDAFEFDPNGIWIPNISFPGNDDSFFSKFAMDFFRGSLVFSDSVGELSSIEDHIVGFSDRWSKARELSAKLDQLRKELAPLLDIGIEFTSLQVEQRIALESQIQNLEKELGDLFSSLNELLTINEKNLQPFSPQLQKEIDWINLGVLRYIDVPQNRQELLLCNDELDQVGDELYQLQGREELSPAEIELRSQLATQKRECVAKKNELEKKGNDLRAEIVRHVLEKNLELTAQQAAGFARSIQQNLYGYHKRLLGLCDFDPNGNVDYTVAFSREGERIIAKLHTKTDPELYSEFEIQVSDLTNEHGEPQRAPIKLVCTKSKHSKSGSWDSEGYHYNDPVKAEKFFASMEEKLELEEKKALYAERNMLIEFRNHPDRIKFNDLYNRREKLAAEYAKLEQDVKGVQGYAVERITGRAETRILEIEREMIVEVGYELTKLEQIYGEHSSTPNPCMLYTDAQFEEMLTNVNKFCGLDENDFEAREVEALIPVAESKKENVIQPKEATSKAVSVKPKPKVNTTEKEKAFQDSIIEAVNIVLAKVISLLPTYVLQILPDGIVSDKKGDVKPAQPSSTAVSSQKTSAIDAEVKAVRPSPEDMPVKVEAVPVKKRKAETKPYSKNFFSFHSISQNLGMGMPEPISGIQNGVENTIAAFSSTPGITAGGR